MGSNSRELENYLCSDQQFAPGDRELDGQRYPKGDALAIVVHTSYHLGETRQALSTVGEPSRDKCKYDD